MTKGIWYAVGAYSAWGLLTIYWKWLHMVPATQLIGHRILWSCLILWGIILFSRQWQTFRSSVLHPRVLLVYAIAAVLVSVNWLTYVWAVNAGFIVETSLGYFITPLLSVLLGVVFLRERLRPGQWAAVGLAAAGVLYLTLGYGALPWIGLTLAFTFSLYGLIKKTAPLGPVHGLSLETGILFLPALLYLLYAENSGQGSFVHNGLLMDLLMVGAGLVTTIPLLLFASAAQLIPLSLIGLFQYITPTLQFLIGLLIYQEPFTPQRFLGFGIVWAALLIFAIEGFLTRRTLLVSEVPAGGR
jgi:chloramphenicol-sensitive protein RarD